MSYSVRLKKTLDGYGERYINPTYNLTPIFDFALTGEPLPSPNVSEMERVLFRKPVDRPRGLCILHDRRADETLPMIENALARMRDPKHAATFAALEPENKWGDLPGAISVFECMHKLATEYPERIWDIT